MSIPLFRVRMSPESVRLVTETLQSGYVGQGPKVDQFEATLADMLKVESDSVVTTNSCTSAIDLALHLIGVGPGDVVISTPMTCSASNSPIVTRGAKIAWADIDPFTGLIAPESVLRLLERYPKAKAIMAVDWAGRSCDYLTLRSFGVPVIQDAAHSLAPAGFLATDNRGRYVCYSFQAIKFLTTVDGGALLTPPDQIERARLLRWYGLDRRSNQSFRFQQNIAEVGYKFHMNDVAASIGLGNIPYALDDLHQNGLNARWLSQCLRDLPGITLPPPDLRSSWWLYTLLVDNAPGFIRFMASKGIDCSPVHSRNDRHSGFQEATVNPQDSLPGVDYFASREVAIPVGWYLTRGELDAVVSGVKAYSATLSK